MRYSIKIVLILAVTIMAANNYAQSGKIKEITIKYSGFLEPEEFTIRFNEDYDIVEVLNRGKSVPKDSLYCYEPLLHDYLQYRELEGIMPRLSRLERDLRKRRRVDSTHLREAIRLKRNLDSLQVGIAIPADSVGVRYRKSIRFNNRVLDSLRVRIRNDQEEKIRHRISREMKRTQRDLENVRSRLEEEVQLKRRIVQVKLDRFVEALVKKGLIEDKEDVNIKNKNGNCWINGRQLTPEENVNMKELWNKYLDSSFEESNSTIQL